MSFLPAAEENPSTAIPISVIIPCRNEEKNIPYILSDIISQAYPPDLTEVIVVDDWSDDITSAIAESYKQIPGLKVIRNKGHGKKQALKTGIEAAKNRYIITTDADCRLPSGLLKGYATIFSEKNPEMVIGPVTIEGGKGFLVRFQELEFISLQAVTAATVAAGNPVMCNGASLGFRKETWLSCYKEIREDLPSGDDIFFLQCVKRIPGSEIAWLESDNAMVKTRPSRTLMEFILQRARWLGKAPAYNDSATKGIAIVTFVTILDLILLTFLSILNIAFFKVLLAAAALKATADFIILAGMCSRRGKMGLLKWFVPSQLIYPVYVLAVSVLAFSGNKKWK